MAAVSGVSVRLVGLGLYTVTLLEHHADNVAFFYAFFWVSSSEIWLDAVRSFSVVIFITKKIFVELSAFN